MVLKFFIASVSAWTILMISSLCGVRPPYTLHADIQFYPTQGDSSYTDSLVISGLHNLTLWGLDKMAAILQMKCVFLNETCNISIKISLKIVPKDAIHIISLRVQVIAWHQTDNKQLAEPMLTKVPDTIWHQ